MSINKCHLFDCISVMIPWISVVTYKSPSTDMKHRLATLLGQKVAGKLSSQEIWECLELLQLRHSREQGECPFVAGSGSTAANQMS